jgi:hypothetical protein
MLLQHHGTVSLPGVRRRLRVHGGLAWEGMLLRANLSLRPRSGQVCCSLLLK